MKDFFRGRRRKVGCVTLVMALVFVGGCDGNHSSEFRTIDRISADSTHPDETVRRRIVGTAVAAGPTEMIDDSTTMKSTPAQLPQLVPDSVSTLDFADKRKNELLVPNKTFSKDRKSGALQLTFDDINLLKILNMEPVTDDAVSSMPEWLTSLNGKTVKVRGFMYPTFEAEGLEVFVLLRDNQRCCYGPGAKIYDHIFVKMKPGTTTNYVPLQQSLDVVGQFKIDLQSASGSVFGLYVIEDASVIVR